MQEVDAGMILSPSLFEPWAEALRAKSGSIVRGLRRVLPDGAATERVVQSVEQALFELEGRGVQISDPTAAAVAMNTSVAMKHMMVAYCWVQQPAVQQVQVCENVGEKFHSL